MSPKRCNREVKKRSLQLLTLIATCVLSAVGCTDRTNDLRELDSTETDSGDAADAGDGDGGTTDEQTDGSETDGGLGDGVGCGDLDDAERIPTLVDGWARDFGSSIELGMASESIGCGEVPDADLFTSNWYLLGEVERDDVLPKAYEFQGLAGSTDCSAGMVAQVELIEITDECVIGRVTAAFLDCDNEVVGWFDLRRCG